MNGILKRVVLLSVVGGVGLAAPGDVEFRVWTSRQGTEVTAKVMRLFVTGKTPMVELRTQAGGDLKLRIEQLSDADQDHLYKEYAGEFGKARATPKGAARPKPASRKEGFQVRGRVGGIRGALPDLDAEFLNAAPDGARLSRGMIPVSGDRDGGDAWLQRIIVSHGIWWAQAGMLRSRYQFDSERLEKQMWREFGGKIRKTSGGELAEVAETMNALLEEREGEVAEVGVQYLNRVTPELLCAAAKGPAMVVVNLAVMQKGHTEWESPVAVIEAWENGKLRIGIWDEMMELTMEALPENQWLEVRPGPGPPVKAPVYQLRVDPADDSVNAKHLRDNDYDLRIGPLQGGAALLVYSPRFTPEAAK